MRMRRMSIRSQNCSRYVCPPEPGISSLSHPRIHGRGQSSRQPGWYRDVATKLIRAVIRWADGEAQGERYGSDGEVYSYPIELECSNEDPWTRAHMICYAPTLSPTQ
jgi:hypothetical protein